MPKRHALGVCGVKTAHAGAPDPLGSPRCAKLVQETCISSDSSSSRPSLGQRECCSRVEGRVQARALPHLSPEQGESVVQKSGGRRAGPLQRDAQPYNRHGDQTSYLLSIARQL